MAFLLQLCSSLNIECIFGITYNTFIFFLSNCRGFDIVPLSLPTHATVEIKSVQMEQAGYYVCIAQSDAGSTEETFLLTGRELRIL